MNAIRYQASIGNYLAVRAAGRFVPALLRAGRLPGLEYIPMAAPALPGADWLRLRPRLCGICGSDMALLTGHSSPALSPFASFPAVPGHEILAEVVETGAAVADVAPGDRVVVDPCISCAVRGLEDCASCRRGQPSLCLRPAEGKVGRGMLIGFCRALPGGWSEEMIAHRSQVYRVPAAVSDDAAVLVEPLSVGLHAVLGHRPAPESRVLIVGGGSVGLCVLAALRLLGERCHVTVLARYPFQERMARRLGADVVAQEGRGPAGAGRAAVEVAGASAHRPVWGAPVYVGGFDHIFDCVGSVASLDASLRVAGPRGVVVIVGCPGEVKRLDLTFIWARELHVSGSYVYAREPSLAGAPHTFELALRLLAERPDVPLAELVTHRFPLARWREAMRANLRRGRHGALKTVFTCR